MAHQLASTPRSGNTVGLLRFRLPDMTETCNPETMLVPPPFFNFFRESQKNLLTLTPVERRYRLRHEARVISSIGRAADS